MLQFLLIFAHNWIEFNSVSRCTYYLPTIHGVCCQLIATHETAPLFLYSPIKLETYSFKSVLGQWPVSQLDYWTRSVTEPNSLVDCTWRTKCVAVILISYQIFRSSSFKVSCTPFDQILTTSGHLARWYVFNCLLLEKPQSSLLGARLKKTWVR